MALKQLTKILIRKNPWCTLSAIYKHKSHKFGNQQHIQNDRLYEVRRQCFPEQTESDDHDQNENYTNEETVENDENKEDVEQVLSTPADYLENRTVRIYRRCRDPSQQIGTKPNYLWEIDFDTNESEDDSQEHLKLEFPTVQAAINFINKHRWEWTLDPHQIYPYEPKGRENPWNSQSRKYKET